MYKSIEIANYFIKKSLETGIEVDQMKLLKLVYLAHGWYIGNTSEPLLAEGAEAWTYGPVIPSLYGEIKKYGKRNVNEMITYDSLVNTNGHCETIIPIVSGPSITGYLDSVWSVYKEYSGLQLSTITHEEGSPWYKIRYTKSDKAPIPNNIIEEYYKNKIATK